MKYQNKRKLIWHFLSGCRLAFAGGMVATLVIAFASMVSPQIIRIALDNVILGQSTQSLSSFYIRMLDWMGGADYLRDHLWLIALALAAVGAVTFLAQYLFRVLNAYGTETMLKHMRDEIFGHIGRLPFSWHMRNHTGDIIQRCTSDIDTVRGFVSEQLINIVRIVVMVVMSLVFMFAMHWQMALIATAAIPVILIYAVIFYSKIQKTFILCDENEGKLSAMVQENLTGVRVVRAFGREGYEKERFEQHNEYYTGLYTRLAKVMSRYWSSMDIIMGLELMLVIVLGAYYTVHEAMTVGEYIALISYNGMMMWPVRMLGRMLGEMSKAGVSLDRIAAILNSEEEKDSPNAVMADMTGDIDFQHLNFAYEGCPELLHDINLHVPAGTTVGIMGGTGSGKSTLMMLLDKLYDLEDASSHIRIGGVDIRDINTQHLRQNIGIVLQEPYLFSRSIADNIGIKHEHITLEHIREAAAAAALNETVENFAQGYDTIVGERGVTLSGGQRQRTAIARVLTEDSPILIFDDSLSAVDTETDAKIRAALNKKMGHATIFLISHRVATLRNADQIIVLEHGRIREQGTHEQLVAANGVYNSIYQAQTAGVEEL